jgi:hypothetical protein
MYEYLTAVIGYPDTTDPHIKVINGEEELDDWSDIPLHEGLDALGEDGWELAAIHWSPLENVDPIYIFKRAMSAVGLGDRDAPKAKKQRGRKLFGERKEKPDSKEGKYRR